MISSLIMYLSNDNEEIKEILNSIVLPISEEKITDGLYRISSYDSFETLERIKSFESDYLIDIPTYLEEVVLPNNLVEYMGMYLKEMKSGNYRLSDLLTEIALLGRKDVLDEFKSYFSTKIPEEIISTGLSFVLIGNAIKASKELYIHRNTLNYRIDVIKRETSLDLKDFKDQLSFYSIFR